MLKQRAAAGGTSCEARPGPALRCRTARPGGATTPAAPRARPPADGRSCRKKPICSAKASLRSGVRRSSSMTRRSDSEYAKKASISKPLKSRGNAPRPRYVDSQSFMFCRWAPQYAHRISGQQVLDQPWGKRCQALELPRESSGTFGAGSGWLLRLTTDQMRRERGG
jgi:hypothetical protein